MVQGDLLRREDLSRASWRPRAVCTSYPEECTTFFIACLHPVLCCRCWKLVRDKKYVAKYTVPSVQKPEGLMVWAAMKANGAICLRRCPPKVDAIAYRSILSSAKAFIKPRCASIDPGTKPHLCSILQGPRLDVPARWSSSASGHQHHLLAAAQGGGAAQRWSVATDEP